MRKWPVVTGLALVATGALLSAQATITPRTAERAFAPSGHVWMQLSAGEYRIRAGRDDRVFVQLTTPDPDDIAGCRITLEPKGRDMLVATRGPNGGMIGVIEVPARSDLNVRLSAGDLSLQGVRGSKDLSSWAGDFDIEVGAREDYRAVHASVTAGNLSAGPFDVRKEGLFRSFNWRGPGAFALDVRLTAGNLTLR